MFRRCWKFWSHYYGQRLAGRFKAERQAKVTATLLKSANSALVVRLSLGGTAIRISHARENKPGNAFLHPCCRMLQRTALCDRGNRASRGGARLSGAL